MDTIRRTVISCGEEEERVLLPGDKVKCLRCGQDITISDSTVQEIKGEKYIVCPNRIKPKNEELGGFRCGRIISAYYYAHRIKTEPQPRDGEVKIIKEADPAPKHNDRQRRNK